MKSLIKSILVVSFGIATMSFANAESFSPKELVEASRVAMDAFLTANPDQEEFVTGQKSWEADPDSKVKIYVTHHGGHSVEINYTCAKDNTNKVSCTEN